MQFIEHVAECVIKHASSYAIAVHSPIIAQAVLESASGTSELAVNANNFLGIKYRPGRCPTSTGVYYKVGSEQSIDGSYASSVMKWCKFDNMEDCIIGYFDFINISRYANLKGVADPEEYLNLLKADGYATSLKYVENVMNVIKKYDLTKYDRKEVSSMSNSPLVSYTKLSPNKTSPRNHVIDTITIHCVVGQLTAEGICNCFTSPSRKASCNYGIGHDGKIALVVDEKDRSWCSSNAANDHRAVTIEVASDKTHPYTVTWEAYESLIKLCADICKRNGIKELLWRGDKSLIGQVDKQNMTVHRWFANKSCPGDYLYGKHSEIVARVNALLKSTSDSSSTTPATAPQPSGKVLYKVQTGAFKNKANAEMLSAQVNTAGFKSIVIYIGGLYKVQVGAYSKKENADQQAAKLKAAGFNCFISKVVT